MSQRIVKILAARLISRDIDSIPDIKQRRRHESRYFAPLPKGYNDKLTDSEIEAITDDLKENAQGFIERFDYIRRSVSTDRLAWYDAVIGAFPPTPYGDGNGHDIEFPNEQLCNEIVQNLLKRC